MKRSTLHRILLLWTMSWVILLLVGCSTAWTTEAVNIITLLGPSITSALAILAAFGVGISPAAVTAMQQWSSRAITGLGQVKTMIEQYNAAEVGAKPGLLTEIQTALSLIVSDLTAILPTIKVTDAATQAKITAIVEAVAAELQGLVNLVPALQGKVTSHDELKKLIAAVKTAKEYKADFNTKVAAFGPSAKQYEI
jgi:hypothetical protein